MKKNGHTQLDIDQRTNNRDVGKFLNEIIFIKNLLYYKVRILMIFLFYFISSLVLFLLIPINYYVDKSIFQDQYSFFIICIIVYGVGIVLFITTVVPDFLAYITVGPLRIYENGFLPPSPIFIDRNKTTIFYFPTKRFIKYNEIQNLQITLSNNNKIILNQNKCITKKIDEWELIDSFENNDVDGLTIFLYSKKYSWMKQILNRLIFNKPKIDEYNIPINNENRNWIKSFISIIIHNWRARP